MISFNIQKPDTAITTALQDKIDKPDRNPKGHWVHLKKLHSKSV